MGRFRLCRHDKLFQGLAALECTHAANAVGNMQRGARLNGCLTHVYFLNGVVSCRRKTGIVADRGSQSGKVGGAPFTREDELFGTFQRGGDVLGVESEDILFLFRLFAGRNGQCAEQHLGF